MVADYPAAAALRRRQIAAGPAAAGPVDVGRIRGAENFIQIQERTTQNNRRRWKVSHLYCLVSAYLAFVAVVCVPLESATTNKEWLQHGYMQPIPRKSDKARQTSSTKEDASSASMLSSSQGSSAEYPTSEQQQQHQQQQTAGLSSSTTGSIMTTEDLLASLHDSFMKYFLWDSSFTKEAQLKEQQKKQEDVPPAWIRWALPGPHRQQSSGASNSGSQNSNKSNKKNGKQQATDSTSSTSALSVQFWWGLTGRMLAYPQHLLDSWVDPHLWRLVLAVTNTRTKQQASTGNSSQSDASNMSAGECCSHLLDKVLSSTPRLLAMANWLLSLTYLLHAAVAHYFLGNAGNGNSNDPPTKSGFLLFKLLLISAVVSPDTLDWLILLTWYTLVSFLKSLASLAANTLEEQQQQRQRQQEGLATFTNVTGTDIGGNGNGAREDAATLRQQESRRRSSVLPLLLWVLFWDILSTAACVALFNEAGWDMVVLLTSDCLLLGLEILQSCVMHVHQTLDNTHKQMISGHQQEQMRLLQEQQQVTVVRVDDAERRRRMRMLAASRLERESEEWSDAVAAAPHTEDDGPQTATDGDQVSATSEGMDYGEPQPSLSWEELDRDEGVSTNSEGHRRRRQEEAAATAARQRVARRTARLNELERIMEELECAHTKRVAVLDTAVFWLSIAFQSTTIAHFLHIWKLHSLQFTLIDGVLLLHLHSALSVIMKKVAERRNYHRIARDLDSLFVDATEIDLRKSGDTCCICLGTMAPAKRAVKKVACGHIFHTQCLREVVERARSMEAAQCPLCRARVVDGLQPSAQPRSFLSRNVVLTTNNTTRNANTNTDDNAVDAAERTTDQQLQQQQQQPNERGNNGRRNNQEALFRFSTDGILPFLPAFSFEVVRRPNTPLLNNNTNNDNNTNGDSDGTDQQNQGQQAAVAMASPSLWHQLLWSLGATPSLLTPEAEASALEGLVDMFPQYDRADLLSELRRRGSGEAVVESILVLGTFRGVPRGARSGEGSNIPPQRPQPQQQAPPTPGTARL